MQILGIGEVDPLAVSQSELADTAIELVDVVGAALQLTYAEARMSISLEAVEGRRRLHLPECDFRLTTLGPYDERTAGISSFILHGTTDYSEAYAQSRIAPYSDTPWPLPLDRLRKAMAVEDIVPMSREVASVAAEPETLEHRKRLLEYAGRNGGIVSEGGFIVPIMGSALQIAAHGLRHCRPEASAYLSARLDVETQGVVRGSIRPFGRLGSGIEYSAADRSTQRSGHVTMTPRNHHGGVDTVETECEILFMNGDDRLDHRYVFSTSTAGLVQTKYEQQWGDPEPQIIGQRPALRDDIIRLMQNVTRIAVGSTELDQDGSGT